MSKEREYKLQDLATYGVSFSKGGKRIDPRDVYISTEPEQEPEEGVYQKLLRIEDGVEVEILPSELWQDGYETGRKDSQKREPLSDEEIHKLSLENFKGLLSDRINFVRAIEKEHGIGGGE